MSQPAKRYGKKVSRTWFAMDSARYINPRYAETPFGYFFTIQDWDDNRFPPNEACIFSHIAEHEIADAEHRGALAGPITLRVEGKKPRNLLRIKKPFMLPAWVESDGLEIVDCEADGVLLVENATHFEKLRKAKFCERQNLMLATGAGVPRARMRRFLHRLSEERGIPVYWLSDYDTWSYFTFSVLKRGLLAPHMSNRHLAVRDLRFLGLRAHSDCRNAAVRPWKDHWSLRLQMLRQYPCFKRKAWQAEFDGFERTKHGVNLFAVMEELPLCEFMQAFIAEPIQNGDWLS